MKVLIYYSNSENSVFILTAIQQLIADKHTVYLQTTTPFGPLHSLSEQMGAKTFFTDRPTHRLKKIFELIIFCYKHQINFVFPHLQDLNLVALLSQPFISAAVFPMRHHADDVYLSGNKNALLIDRIINKFSLKILVVSEACRKQMVTYEKVNNKKIIVMKLYYNFDYYKPGNKHPSYKADANEKLSVINIGRMVENKNHKALLVTIKRLVNEGFNIRLQLLDGGPLENRLKDFVKNENLTEYVSFLGRQGNVIDYITDADILVHTSVSEASCQVTKEAGICKRPVITVKGVGDFDEYIIDKENGFTLSASNIEEELYQTLKYVYNNKTRLTSMGEKLEKSVRDKFDVSNASITYSNIINGTYK